MILYALAVVGALFIVTVVVVGARRSWLMWRGVTKLQ